MEKGLFDISNMQKFYCLFSHTSRSGSFEYTSTCHLYYTYTLGTLNTELPLSYIYCEHSKHCLHSSERRKKRHESDRQKRKVRKKEDDDLLFHVYKKNYNTSCHWNNPYCMDGREVLRNLPKTYQNLMLLQFAACVGGVWRAQWWWRPVWLDLIQW